MSLPAARGTPYRIAFVCLGNICRSPMADVILSSLVEEAGLGDRVEVTSCGTGDWHLGHEMDKRAAAELVARGYDASAHRAQQWQAAWLDRDLVLAMDEKNLADITEGRGADDRVRLVIVEGNYLLLDTPPWNGVRPMLDEAWFVHLDDDERRRRMMRRHEGFGHDPETARARTLGTDERNAQLVNAAPNRPDLWIEQSFGTD